MTLLQSTTRAVGKDHPGLRVAQIALTDGQADLGGAAEQQNRLGVTYRVEHHLAPLQASGTS